MADARALGEAMQRWLLDSGAQVTGSGPDFGGVRAGYDTRARRWLYVYPEITGYAASIFVMLFRHTGDERFRAAAVNAGNFLLRIQADAASRAPGAFAKEVGASEHYTFDTAMCVQGLVSLFDLTGDEGFVDAARRGGDWLLRMQRDDGSFLSRIDVRSGDQSNVGPYFHQDGGCLHAKHAIGLLQLSKATGDPRYEQAAIRVCDWVLSLQDADGAFLVNGTRSHVYAHAHCYATEGLLAAYDRLGIEAHGLAVERACEWLERVLTPNGVYGTHKTSRELARVESQSTNGVMALVRRVWPRREIATDATLQAARIFRFRAARGDDPRANDTADRFVASILAKVANTSDDPSAYGGLHARLETSLGVPRRAPLIATWPVQFGAHACLQTADPSSAGHVVF